MQIEEEKREHDQKMKKMEAEMEQVFEMKVKEKKQKLKDSENDVSSVVLFYCSNWLHKGKKEWLTLKISLPQLDTHYATTT